MPAAVLPRPLPKSDSPLLRPDVLLDENSENNRGWCGDGREMDTRTNRGENTGMGWDGERESI